MRKKTHLLIIIQKNQLYNSIIKKSLYIGKKKYIIKMNYG